MTISKLPSGKWRVQAYFVCDGQVYRPSYTANTKAECQYWYAEQKLKYKNYHPSQMTVRKAVEKYIDLGKTLSPKSINSYEKIVKYAFKSIMDVDVDDLTDIVMQQAINEESKRPVEYRKDNKAISPKTVCNEWGLLSTALKQICGKTFNVRLPKKIKKFKIYPHPQIILPIIKNTEIEIPCLMAMFLSLRMSEVRGVKYSSIKDNYIYIEQVKVYVDGIDIVKESPKTYGSTRKVKMPVYLQNLISNQPHTTDYVVNLTENQISKRFSRLMKANGLELTFHDLRHLFASAGAFLGIEPLYLADIGGWEDQRTMMSVYEEIIGSEKQAAEDKLASYFDSLAK